MVKLDVHYNCRRLLAKKIAVSPMKKFTPAITFSNGMLSRFIKLLLYEKIQPFSPYSHEEILPYIF